MATQQFLAKAYLAYFGRPVDPIGAYAFQSATEAEVFEAFYASPESQALYGTGFGASQITAIYQMLFNRDPEPAGTAYWLNQVTLGLLTPAGAALGILNGARNEDAVAVANKLSASGLFTASLNTLAEADAYVGDAAAAHARAFLKSIDILPATQSQVDNEISSLMDINGPGVHGAPNVFTLTEAVVGQEVILPQMERVIMWGYNPHPHDETSGVDNLDGNNPDGNDNNLTNEGPEDGGVPIEVLYEYIQTVAGLDLVQLGLINVANGEDGGSNDGQDTSTQLFADVTGMDIVNNGDGTQTISVTLSDGTVNTAEVAISQQFFDLIHGWLFDEEGNSRIYETVRAVDVNDVGSTVDILAPIVLTSFENNGGTVERNADGQGPVTTSGDDLIVAGRLELLHGAYIDGGAGYNTLEVDAKGTYAQPLELTRIQKVVVQNLPNVYTTSYGSGDGYLDNSTYPDLSLGSSGSDDSVLDLSRAVDIECLVITEGSDTGRDLGELTVVGVRNGATLRLEGAFTEDINVHYGEGLTGPLTVELLLGQVTANLNFAHNTDVLNLVSMGGVGNVNTFGTEDLGGRLSTLNISGDAALYISGDLDDSFQDDSPVVIDASTNKGGVSLQLSDSQNVTFLGSLGNDRFMVDTAEADTLGWMPENDQSVVIVGGAGNNYYEVDTYTATITNGDGNNNYEVDAAVVSITAGNGANDLEINDSSDLTVTLGNGNNVIEAVIGSFGSTTDPSSSVDETGTAVIVLGSGKNTVDVEGGSGSSVSVTAGNGGNSIDVSASTITVTTGTGKDTIKVEGSNVTVTSGGGADAITVMGTSTDYVPGNDGALLKLTVGADATVNLGASSSEFPGQGTITAHQDSFITGTNVKLVVNTTADLQAATLTGVTKVVLDDDVLTTASSQGANDGGEHAMLTLTSAQFAAIGADNFSVDGSLFSTHAYVKIVVTASTSLTALGVDDLPSNIDVYLELNDGVTLTMTAEQLHTRVAQDGVTLADDSNTDTIGGKVVITGGGLNFDPFNTSDTVSTVIAGSTYYGGSLSSDFSGFNVTVRSLVNGYDRPADAENVVVLTLDSTGTLPLTQAGFTTSMHNNLEIIGDQDITFTGDINLGEGFTIDFSALEGTVTNMTIAQFQDVEQIRGNGDATVYVKLENKNNTATEMSDPNGAAATGAEGADPTVAEAGVENGLVSSGVAKYIVTDIFDDTVGSGETETGVIYLCDNTEDLEVIGLRGNYSATLEINQVPWGVNFELQGGSTLKADGPTGTSNVGILVANYEFDHADAVVTLTHSVAGDTREIKAYGIEINNADSITVNVTAGDATIDMIAGDSLNELIFSSANDITVGDPLPSAVTTIDASDVDGTFEASLAPADDFSFEGGAGGSDLTFTADFEASEDTSIDGGTGGATITIAEDQSVDLDEATLANIDSFVLEDDSTLELTIAQAGEVGAANFILADGDDANLNLTNLDDTLFVRPAFDEDITIAVVSVAPLPTVTLNAGTDLTGIGGLSVHEGTTLNLTAAQFQQLTGDGTITLIANPAITADTVINITGLTAADVADGFSLASVAGAFEVNLILAESVDLSEATLTGVDSITFGDDITLTLGDIQQADGVDIVGGDNSTLKFTDTTTAPFEDIDASGFDVTTLMFLNTLTDGGNRNIDDIFGGLAESIHKVVYNGQGWVNEIDQVVSVEAGTTVLDSLAFNPSAADVELQNFTINLLGGTELDGNLRLSTGDKFDDLNNDGIQDAGENDLIRTYLQNVTINSTGTTANLLTGETANVITGDITPETAIGGQDNNLLNLTINASQDLIVEGDVVFMSNVGGDSISGNDIEDAVAVLTVTGAADVTLGGIDTQDNDVDGLNVVNSGTGTLSITIDAADIDAGDDLSFTGTGDIELTVVDTQLIPTGVDLSDDDLSAVSQITINDDATLTLTQAQLQALGAGNVLDGETTGSATLNLVEFGSTAFDATALDGDIDVDSITLIDADVTLNAATNLTGVGEIVVQEGRTLTLTAAQFQQLAGDGTIVGADTDGDAVFEAFNVVITDLTQADVDAGFDLSAVDVNGGTITITLGELSVDLGTFVDGALVGGSDAVLNGAQFVLADNETLGVVSFAQADGLDVDGGANTTIVYKFTNLGTDNWPVQINIDASGYDVTTLKALAASFVAAGQANNVEFSIDDLPSSVELRLYEDPADLGFLDPTFRVVVIEEGITTPTGLVFNDYDATDELRTLDLTLEGDVTLNGDLMLPTRSDKDGSYGASRYFDTLMIHSEGALENTIDGDITTSPPLAFNNTDENNLLNVEIHALQDLVITGDIVFNSVDVTDNDAEATLTITGTADVTIQQLNTTDVDIETLTIAQNGTGTLTVTGASPAFDGDNTENLILTGTGDIVFGTEGEGVTAEELSVIDASGLSGDLTLGEVDNIDSEDFTFTAGSGVTTMTLTTDSLDSTNGTPGDLTDDTAGWTFDFSAAAAGSEFHLGALGSLTDGSVLNIDLGANTTLYIDSSVDLSGLDLSIIQTLDIVVADGATLTLTAAQASGLSIVGADLTPTGVVNIVDLGDTAVDLSGIAANIAGTITLEDNDVTVHASTNLGAADGFTVVLEDLANADSLAGQTIRFNTVAQAERAIRVEGFFFGEDTDPGAPVVLDADTVSSTNVVWLFTSITNPAGVDTANYDAELGRLWLNDDLINNEGGLIESLFTTLPSSILRVDFADVTALNILLASNAVDRTVEFVSFTTVGNLTFSDTGATPEEHIRTLTLELGGEATIGNILIDDVVAAPDTDPASVSFDGLTIVSHRSVKDTDLLAAESYVNDNDGTDEAGEHFLPDNINTVGNIGVGVVDGVDLLMVTLDTQGVTTEGGGANGDGAELDVGTITYETGDAGETAELFIMGDNDITIAAINTADADIIAFTLDATGFTAVLDPVLHVDNTQTVTLDNSNSLLGTLTFQEVEGNELSTFNSAEFDGTLNVTFSQIDSSDDGVADAFTFTAGLGVSTVVVEQVGANIPTLNAGSTWVFDLSDAAAGSTLTLDATVALAAGSNLTVDLGASAQLIIDGNLNLSAVNLSITGGSILVSAGDILTLSLAQVQQLDTDGVMIVGGGTVKVNGDGTDAATASFDDPLRTVNVDFSAITLDLVAPGADGTLAFEAVLTGGLLDDGTTAAGQSVVGSVNDDNISTADDLNDTLSGGLGNDTLDGGVDTGAPLTTDDNTYTVTAGTDTIVGLNTGDVLVVSAGAIANAALGVASTTAGDFVATAATVNAGTVNLTDADVDQDSTIDMTLATGTAGYTLTGGTSATLGADTLIGSAQADTLNGGNTTQTAAPAADTLTGNGGDDTFVFLIDTSDPVALTAADDTVAGNDDELWTIATPFGADADGAQLLTVLYRNGATVGNFVISDDGTIDFTSIDELGGRLASELSSRGLSSTYATNDITVNGSAGQAVEIISITPTGAGFAAAEDGAYDAANDVEEQSTVTVGDGTVGVVTVAGEIYTITASPAYGDAISAEYVADGTESEAMLATALAGVFNAIAMGVSPVDPIDAVAAGNVITLTDNDADTGGFTLSVVSAGGVAGTGASALGAGAGVWGAAFADVITDFVSGDDLIQLDIEAGTNTNYREAVGVTSYLAAFNAAEAAFTLDGAVRYYLTSIDGSTLGEDATGLLFFDANGDQATDGVILLTGVTSANFDETDIIL